MRIAIQNTYFGKRYAETELARRIVLAAERIGWDAIEAGTAAELHQYQPDFVLVLHFKTPKLTPFPTYGCLWNPTVLIETDKQFIRHILSYDAYLASANTTEQWLGDRLYNTPKKYFIAPFFTSCNRTDYRAPSLRSPHIAYVGTNWDGERFKDLFLALEQQHCSEIYGNPTGWAYLKSSYRGALPFDGVSVLNALNQAGVGLCLHRDEHTREGIPSMRIFEIAASGAIAICGEHSFIRKYFADTVLYLDHTLNVTEQVAQITDHLNWITTHPETVLEMSREAHRIFVENFALETLLLNLQPYHQALCQQKRPVQHISVQSASTATSSLVQLIVRTRDRTITSLQKTLDSIKQQTYPNIVVLLLNEQNLESLHPLLKNYQNSLSLEVLNYHSQPYHSHDLWQGLQSLAGDYFGILESGSVIYPTHLETLVQILNQFPQIGIAYSEVVQIQQNDPDPAAIANSYEILDRAILAPELSSEFADLLPFTHAINLNSFVARSPLIDELLKRDPKLMYLEELFLLLNLGTRDRALFSYEVTCEVQEAENQLTVGIQPFEEESFQRIQMMMRDREFAGNNTYDKLKQTRWQLQQTQTELQAAQQRIAAMETSKFWQLRKLWLQLKHQIKQ
ncbi:MAG: hypothetical protein NW220_15885 [Leptolyngbyaceae cyanobacterium bins.349]|nr:hypothetical protein [Leptolyngbyaceae cyanobacterium bins.349]